MKMISEFQLRNAPFPAKVMIAGFLFALGLSYVYAVANIALVVGLSPREIAIHYYGAENSVPKKSKDAVDAGASKSGEESFDLDQVDQIPADPLGPRPSFKNLVQQGHFHLFGMTTFFFILTGLALFTPITEPVKPWAMGLPYLAVVFDNVSFMATRFLGPKFAYLTVVAGAVMGLLFTILWIAVAFEISQKRTET